MGVASSCSSAPAYAQSCIAEMSCVSQHSFLSKATFFVKDVIRREMFILFYFILFYSEKLEETEGTGKQKYRYVTLQSSSNKLKNK